MKAVGASKPADLARALGLDSYGSPRRVKRWLDGETEPDYEATLRLLDAVGLLKRDGRPRRRESASDVEVLAAAVKSGFQSLERRLERLEQQRSPAVRQARTRSASK